LKGLIHISVQLMFNLSCGVIKIPEHVRYIEQVHRLS
jgi:hypothetical protein